jgi:hypothetical protein
LLADHESAPTETLPSVYLIDACSLLWLDGVNQEPDGANRYNPDEQAKVWARLDDLVRHGNLKLTTDVKGELRRMGSGSAVRRLAAYSGHKVQRRTNALRVTYQQVVASHLNGNHPVVRPEWVRDPADPWLVAYAKLYGYTIITDELPAALHRTRSKRQKVFIPDLCGALAPPLPWFHLRDLAISLGWIVGP